jgi:hypothetical protein
MPGVPLAIADGYLVLRDSKTMVCLDSGRVATVNNETYNWMKKRGLTIVILVILTVIIAVIVVDFLNNRPDRRGENPYALEVDQYKEVDPELISHRETRKFRSGVVDPFRYDPI